MSRLPRVSPIASRPLLVTSDTALTDAVLAVASEARVELTVANDLGAAAVQWTTAPLVMLDADVVGDGTSIPARPGIVIVTRPIEDAARWRTLVDAGAERIVELPHGAPWLYERLGRSLESDPVSDLVVVIGAAGGAGTSTLAAAMARYAHEQAQVGVLVDLDPCGGGADLMLGGESAGGARWDELAGVQGRVDDRILLQALPVAHGLPLLSWPATSEVEPDVVSVGHVLDALARSGVVTIIDAGRGLDPRGQVALARAGRVVVVVPLRVRAVASARRVLARLPQHVEPLVVVREPAPGGLDADDVESALAVPVAATMPDDRRRGAVEELGGPAPRSAQWRRLCETLLADPMPLTA